jgi:hypothetical protein
VTILRRNGNLSRAPSASAPTQALPAPETLRPSRQVEGPAILPAGPPVGRIHIERLILHSLNNHTGEVRLVDEVALLNDEAELFFSAHIEAAMARADWKARFMEPSGDVALWCRDLLGTLPEYVRASQQLARRLFTHMRPRTIAPGDFVALTYRRGEDPLPQIALFKLDPDHRLVRTFEALNGRMRVSISVVENLLPDSTRLQKCALLSSPSPEAEFEVTLLDNQAGPRADGVAAFFYRGFLMTELAPSPRRRTREFLHCCDLWLATHQDEFTPNDLVMFYQSRRLALLAECLDCRAFARSALPDRPELQDSLLGTLVTFLPPDEGDGGSRWPEFVIDHGIAGSVARKVTLELDGGARLSVPADRFAELVRIEPTRTAENKYRLVIESSTLKEVSDR